MGLQRLPWVYGAGLGAWRERVASGGHPCPSLSGQPQASALPLGPRVFSNVIGVWGIFVFFLASSPFQSEKLLQSRTVFYTPASFNGCACGKTLCSEMGFYVTLGLGMVQNRRSGGYGRRAVLSPCSRRDQTPFCCRQTSSLCYRSDPHTRQEKSMEASPSIAKEGISIIFSFSGCHAMTFVLQLKIRLQRAFCTIQKRITSKSES